jgi:uncharacterized protein
MIRRRSRRVWHGAFAALVLLLCLAGSVWAQTQNLPPKPATYVTDQAGILDASTVATLNDELEQFEKDTSDQILVVIYPSLPPDAEAAQFATYTYNAWGVGQKGKDNGAILFVFVNDHQMFIVTGRGLEGALPDATCKEIITQIISPAFKQGNYAAGIQSGVNAMLAAAKGEYKGTGTTVAERKGSSQGIPVWLVIIFIIIIVFIRMRSSSAFGGPIIYTGGGWGGGGFGGGFGGGGGGGGGFSGGGGSSAGGGAGGGW